ncbi:hypothetical protein HMPREF9442_00516 [Paraprevotella xylaniphila YIT 11841]|uniref:Uncharacterized protein n=1 Tax=Paraprevotella xylaniphila YIT 11841 TaxID=762982 RepID=F3QQS3_9BACT|nr:hypothetical protein HMPREF9442_00516 [Paraprevotella xylaniphila YIT 11841]
MGGKRNTFPPILLITCFPFQEFFRKTPSSFRPYTNYLSRNVL